MDIIIFCNKDGRFEGDCDFREIEICNEDEQNINLIIGHSIGKEFKLKKVCVLDELDYLKMKNKSEEWEEYQEWKEAKKLYEKYKERYEDVKSE